MAQDEGRFGRISTPKWAWAPPGIRPKAPRQVMRQSSDISAVVAPEQGLMTSLILPSADRAMMNLFLAQVAEDFADDFLVMHVDQAGWHRAKELQVPENSRLIFQPASRPEVNAVEHVWEEVREKYLHTRVFPSLDDLIEVLCQALTEVTEDKERLHSMMFFPRCSFLTSDVRGRMRIGINCESESSLLLLIFLSCDRLKQPVVLRGSGHGA